MTGIKEMERVEKPTSGQTRMIEWFRVLPVAAVERVFEKE